MESVENLSLLSFSYTNPYLIPTTCPLPFPCPLPHRCVWTILWRAWRSSQWTTSPTGPRPSTTPSAAGASTQGTPSHPPHTTPYTHFLSADLNYTHSQSICSTIISLCCGCFHGSGPLCSLVMDGCKRVLVPTSSSSSSSGVVVSTGGAGVGVAPSESTPSSSSEEEGLVRQGRSLTLVRAALMGEITSCSTLGRYLAKYVLKQKLNTFSYLTIISLINPNWSPLYPPCFSESPCPRASWGCIHERRPPGRRAHPATSGPRERRAVVLQKLPARVGQGRQCAYTSTPYAQY